MSNRRRALLGIGNGSILPPEYQAVEYLESTGTQYIDTGYIMNNNSQFNIDCEFTEYNAEYYIGGFDGNYIVIGGLYSRTDKLIISLQTKFKVEISGVVTI